MYFEIADLIKVNAYFDLFFSIFKLAVFFNITLEKKRLSSQMLEAENYAVVDYFVRYGSQVKSF